MDNCMLVNRPSLNLVGISYSGPYSTFPDEALRLQAEFLARKHELNDAVDTTALISPYYGNEAFATYWACFEVRQLAEVPPGMVQLTIPEHAYAMVACTNKRIGEAYEHLFAWMKEQGLAKRDNAVALEIFFRDEHMEEELVEILVPVLDESGKA